jgi:tRNA pseudouridine55 synthase
LADIHGILLLDKPLHVSSAAAVARAKRLFHANKAGHTGSLDPLATGMLPICFGEATKFGALLLDADKTYRVTVRLGERTPSADRESQVVERAPVPSHSEEELKAALARFPRRYEQTPPMHSALKQEGRPLYEYARAGIVRERASRTILIHELDLLEWRPPELCFDVRCTKGAYMRVLAEDLGRHLGTLGHLAALRRLGVAPFGGETQWGFEALEGQSPTERIGRLLAVDAALIAWPRFDLPSDGVPALLQGRTVAVAASPLAPGAGGTVRIYTAGQGFLGLGQLEPSGRLVPVRLISAHANRA